MRFFPPSKLQTREFNWGMLTLLSTDRSGRTTPSLCAGGTCGRKPLQTRESIRECWHHHQQTGVVEPDSHCAPVAHVACGRKPLQTRESIKECWHHHQQTGVVEPDSHCALVARVVENHNRLP